MVGNNFGGGKKKFRVYTKNDKGNVVKVEFGQPGVKIAKSAAARKSFLDRKSTRLNSSHVKRSRMPSSA